MPRFAARASLGLKEEGPISFDALRISALQHSGNSEGSWSSGVRALGFLLLVLGLVASAPGAERPPNIVLFYVDDLGWKDVGVQGSPIFETPHIDGLAGEGVRFTQAYSACPVCSPSRAALLTGKSPARVGFTGHITAIGRHRYPEKGRIIPPNDHTNLPLSEVSIALALRPAGYVSASVGKWHVGDADHDPLAHGFDRNVAGHTHGSPASYFFPYRNPELEWNPEVPGLATDGRPGEYLTDRLTDEAVAFIRANRERPFFLYLPHYAVHTPLQAPSSVIEKYAGRPDLKAAGVDPVYAAMVEKTDDSLGRILAVLAELDLDEDTVVIVSSDNGGLDSVTDNSPLRAGKGYLYEGGIRVPLIVRWPGESPAGGRAETPVITHDLYPTIAELAGSAAKPEADLDGVSLIPVLRDPSTALERELFWYYPHYSPQARRPGAAIRSGDYKLIEHYDPPKVELYHLQDDPSERRDLAAEQPEVADRLLKRLHRLIADAGTKMHRPNPNFAP